MYSKLLTVHGTVYAPPLLPTQTQSGRLLMTDQTLANVAAETESKPVSKEKLLIAALLGVGGMATFGWVALIGWGVIYLIGSLTG